MKKIKILILFSSIIFCFKIGLATEKTENFKEKNILEGDLKKDKTFNKISYLDEEKIKNFLKENLKYCDKKANEIKENLVLTTENFFTKNLSQEKNFIYQYCDYTLCEKNKNKIQLNKLEFIFNEKNNEIKLSEIKKKVLTPHMTINLLTENFLNKLKDFWDKVEQEKNYFIKQNFKSVAENFKKFINKQIIKNPFKKKYIYEEELNLVSKTNTLKNKKIKIIFKLFEDEYNKEKLKLNVKINF